MPQIEDETRVSAIQRLELEMAEVRGKMKTIKDDLKDIAEQDDEYRTILEELKELTGKRVAAKKILENNKDYQAVSAELEELKYKYNDLEEIMSHHLVEYFGETKSTEVPSIGGETQQITIKAKLGR